MPVEYNTLKLAVEGYPDRLSYQPGDEVAFHCSSQTSTFSVEIARIGAGREVTVLDLLAGLGCDLEPQFEPPRTGELQRSALDPSKAERLFGWRAEVPLAEGLSVTYESVAARRAHPDARPPGAFATG